MTPGTKIAVISPSETHVSPSEEKAEKAAPPPPPPPPAEKEKVGQKADKVEPPKTEKPKAVSPPPPKVSPSEPQLPPKERERRVSFFLFSFVIGKDMHA